MDVATADARIVYGNEYIVGRLEGGFWSFFEGDGVGFGEDEGEILGVWVSYAREEGSVSLALSPIFASVCLI